MLKGNLGTMNTVQTSYASLAESKLVGSGKKTISSALISDKRFVSSPTHDRFTTEDESVNHGNMTSRLGDASIDETALNTQRLKDIARQKKQMQR